MIGRLAGELVEKQAPILLLDVNGVGYEIQAPMTTFFRLPELGSRVVLHTHFSVSENAQQLFGFVEKTDRELFRLLIKINGVGPKMAVSIMSMDSADFVRCVREDNVTALVKVPGVGKKTAERLIIEMRDKLNAWGEANTSKNEEGLLPTAKDNVQNGRAVIAEAESALVALGYKPADASRVVSKLYSPDITKSEELIRMALKSMMPA